MRIFICASKHCYQHVERVKEKLEEKGHIVTVPNSFEEPMKEEELRSLGVDAHREWKRGMLEKQKAEVDANDAILVLNFEKNGQQNYIGGATFLEIYRAFDTGKPVYLYNAIPEGMLYDELLGMGVIVIDSDLTKIV